jgi:ISXO2-like transposase domain
MVRGGREAARARTRRARKGRPGHSHKNAVLTLVERGGRARSFHIDGQAISDIMPIVRENVSREATVMTDEAHYYGVAGEFAAHKTVTHSKDEYVRNEVWIEGNKLHIEAIYLDQHGRRLLFDLQTRHEGHLPALPRKALAPIFGRVRFSV